MENQENVVCVLCGEEVNDGGVSVTRGINKIKECSRKLEDGVEKLLHNVSEVTIHVACRKSYTDERKIKAAVKDREFRRISLRTAPERDSFDYKKDCVVCGTPCPPLEQRLKHPERNPVSTVSTLIIHESMRAIAVKRNDHWGHEVRTRIDNVIDLVAAEAIYHRQCYVNFRAVRCQVPGLSQPSPMSQISRAGRPCDPIREKAFNDLCRMLEASDECQFTPRELITEMQQANPTAQPFSEKHLIRKLQEKYFSAVCVTSVPGKETLICFKSTMAKLLQKTWYEDRRANPEEEKKRVVQLAADIIRDDIRMMPYDTSKYPSANDVRNDGSDLIPETLRLLLEGIVCKGKKGDKLQAKTKCRVTAEAIISATRPRSFVPPIQVSLAVWLHRRYASRGLIDVLHALGVCASYQEAVDFEVSAVHHGRPLIDESAYVQYVFDNADFNIRTLDGLGTFHAMGGVQCITPARAVQTPVAIPRGKDAVPAIGMKPLASIPVQYPDHASKQGLLKLQIKEIKDFTPSYEKLLTAKTVDLLWLSGCTLELEHVPPGWNGFMSLITRDIKEYAVSAVLPTPFLNLPPSKPTTIYSSLMYASEACVKREQRSCFVTFDNPLYVKAVDLVLSEKPNSPLSSVTVRLGGFHLLMSYMGAVGNIMDGSGLAESWQTVYGKNAVVHMLSGHAYSRAWRAHSLSQQAIITFLLQDSSLGGENLTPEDLKSLADLYEKLMSNQLQEADLSGAACLSKLKAVVDSKLEAASRRGRTACLWVQYYRQVALMRLFIRAERSSDWELHLHSVRQMLPHLHAAGHLYYARAVPMYLQQMDDLHQTLTPDEYDKFVIKGYFSVRRSDKFWAGLWTDLTIEQVLMRSMKTSGGLTQGRGFSESTIARWIHALPATQQIYEALEDVTGVHLTATEQHVELRESRRKRDECDLQKLCMWLKNHSFFEKTPNKVVSLSTGVVGDAKTNCDAAEEVGNFEMNRMVGHTFGSVKLRRTAKVRTLAAIGRSFTVGQDTVVALNPNLMFHRMLCFLENSGVTQEDDSSGKEELSACFAYELSLRPTSLFDDLYMRKGTKSSLIEILQKYSSNSVPLPVQARYVIDGGYLLHKVVWRSAATFLEICQDYVNYVTSKYGKNSAVVFDGYKEGIKDEERARRSAKSFCPDTEAEDNVFAETSQQKFLGNKHNKESFIKLLTRHLRESGVAVFQAEGDADRPIVLTAIQYGRNSVVVGEDTDLLVLLIALSPPTQSTYLMMPGKDEKPSRLFCSKDLQQGLKKAGNLQDLLLFAHAMSGCDSTSAIYRKGKVTAWKKIENCSEEIRNGFRKFNLPGQSKENIACIGEKFMLTLFGAKKCDTSLDEFRFTLYQRSIARKDPGGRGFELSTLPPTSAAALQHSLRVYLQVQEWLGNEMPPEEWGWFRCPGHDGKDVLRPLPTLKDPAPQYLMKIIYCSCSNTCGARCPCGPNKCTRMCTHCAGHACGNHVETDVGEESLSQPTGEADLDPDDPDVELV